MRLFPSAFCCLCQTSTHLLSPDFTLSSISPSSLFRPSSSHYTIPALPKINHGCNTLTSWHPGSLSLYVLNPSINIQLPCLWSISSGWVLFICIRPMVSHPFLLDFRRTTMHNSQSAACETMNSIYSHAHKYWFI